jgi:heme a synthase
MGVEVSPAPAAAPPRRYGWSWLLNRADSPLILRRLALASLVANVIIVVTGGAVRLTNSGLGCPTWPSCSGSSLVATRKLGSHGAIEFANRTLTFVLAAVLLLTLLVAVRQRREIRLAALALAGIPAQAVLGGIVVYTDLNPWLVAAHFLLSAALIATTLLLWWRLSEQPTVAAPGSGILLARAVAVVAAGVLVVGTVVTGSGPHAGDVQNGKVHRIHLATAGLVQLHADAVMVLIGLTIGMVALAYALRLAPALRQAAWTLFGVELAQGAIGYTQYFLHVPALLVAAHMLGACLVWIAALRVVLFVESGATAAGSRRR